MTIIASLNLVNLVDLLVYSTPNQTLQSWSKLAPTSSLASRGSLLSIVSGTEFLYETLTTARSFPDRAHHLKEVNP